jgi:Spy/CpxP family protein refolding chaperone
MCVTVGALAQGTGPAPAPEGPKAPPARMGFSSMDGEGMLLRYLANDPKIAQDIGLTEDQTTQIKKLIADSQTETQGNRAAMGELIKKQAELLTQDNPDEAAAMKAVDELSDLRAQLARQQMKQFLAAQKILTTEQRTQLRELVKTRMEQFRGPRRDGRSPQEGSRPQQPPAPSANP